MPLHAIRLPDSDSAEEGEARKQQIEPVGKLLANQRHLALAAAPGGGKSTLLKRLATAYAFPERRDEIQDMLPKREWLPLFLRCRELRERAGEPMLNLLKTIPEQMSMPAEGAAVFQ